MNEDELAASRITCPVTGHPCDGDLSHLCEDYGCMRKGGLLPHSEEYEAVKP